MANNLIFSHPKMKNSLGIHVNPNQIEWGYGLNVANFSTYGGEVIQILSAYIDDMTIQGNVNTYRQMENIYTWFITYMQIATTGIGHGRFNVQPVTMTYATRGWVFQIYPTGLPGFTYGRDVVAPEWSLQASVVDPDQNLLNDIISTARVEAINSQEGVELFGRATGNIGFEINDPFSDPLGDTAKNQKELLEGKAPRGGYNQLADSYNKLLPAYLEGNFSDLTADYSRPVVTKKGLNKGTAEAKEAVDRNKKQKK